MIWINSIAVAVNLLVGVYILRKYKQHTIWFALWLLLQNWSLISCWYNDLGIFNFELFRYTETTFATARLALFSLIFNCGYWLVMSILSKKRPVKHGYILSVKTIKFGNIKTVGKLIIGLLVCYIIYDFVVNGIPILAGIHKLQFFQEAGILDRFILNYGFLIAFVLGYLKYDKNGYSYSSIFILLMIAYLILVG